MFHLARGEGLGVDVADLLEFQTAFQRYGVIQPAADEEGVFGVGVLAGKPLDALLVRQRLFNLFGQGFQLDRQGSRTGSSARVPRTRANSVASR